MRDNRIRSVAGNRKRRRFTPALSFILALALCVSLLSVLPVAVGAEPYYQPYIDKLVSWNVLRGYPDGNLNPQNPITRAEFVAMVNRAYGYKRTGPTPFQDVRLSDWYYDDIVIAYNARYFNGYSATVAAPNDYLTREQAMILLAKNMRLDEVPGEITEFTDGHDFSSWSRGYVKAAVKKGLINGYPDGSFGPQNLITRGDMATILGRALGTLVNATGTTTLGDVYGNVTINSSDMTLKNTTIAGDLYISGGLGLGGVTLDNVRVLGSIVVAGGGEAQSGDSVVLRNSTADSLRIDSIARQYVSLRAEGDTEIAQTAVRSDAFLNDRTAAGDGLLNISLESEDPGATYSLAGNLENVIDRSASSSLRVAAGALQSLVMDEESAGSILTIDTGAAVRTLDLDTGTPVYGGGDIDRLNISTSGSSSEMLPDTVDIRPGITATVAGEEMDSAQARESSSDPRLLTGYPTAKSIAPTSATAVFSTNKAGTIYWALTSTTDGSAGESVLLDPASSSVLVASGNLRAAASNTEYTAAITKLTAGASYYLSAILVDARGQRSPVKVYAFTAPDNSIPAFATGYPQVLLNTYEEGSTSETKYYVQVGAITTKNCDLYWAVYPTGATAPTREEFRSNVLTGAVAHGVESALRNDMTYIRARGLTETTRYIMYLWLNDADNAKSSNVTSLTFTTVDGTAPEFQFDTPVVTNIAATSLRLSVNVNETGTVYWVVVGRDTTYLSEERGDDYAKRQIESGTNGIRSGNVRVTANTDAVINITGLTAATNYDIYYVAKDGNGNYSDVRDGSGRFLVLQTNTLDNVPPTATQEFTRFSGTDATAPYANTDVHIIFSESVMQASGNQSHTDPRDFVSFYDLYLAVTAAQAAVEASPGNAAAQTALTEARERLAAALSGSIKLYNAASTSSGTVRVRGYTDGVPDNDNDWVIDYHNAVVVRDVDTGTVTVEFPTTNGSDSALNLSSGATYYFVLEDIADVSSSKNRMGRTQLPNFTTISAQVRLQSLNVTEIPGGGGPIPIDMAFSITPVSTNVEDDVDWDALLWSDTSVSFEVYELTNNDGTYTGVPIEDRSGETMQKIVNNAGTDYIALSLFRNFYGLSFNPSVTGEGNKLSTDPERGIMHDGTPKYYGIHFTEVNNSGSAARTTWDATVNFRISVVTGTSVNLGNLASNITENTLADYKANWGVAEIHTPTPFSMRKQFTNSDAPGFYAGYPQFRDVSDTTATLRVMLDRSGTIYYAVAPVTVARDELGNITGYTPSISTELAEPVNEDVTVSTVTINSIPENGNSAGRALRLPASYTIYSPNFGSDDIKSGSISMGSSYRDIPLTDLQPDTLYFAYFVMQGTGQVYSNQVLVYQFTTDAVNRPKLYLVNNGSSTVNVRSRNMNAVADYAVFLMTGLPDELSQPFNQAVDLSKYTAAEIGDTYMSNAYTVYMAMSNQDSTGGSLYDKYAKESHKDAVRQLVTGQVFSYGRIDGHSGVQLTQDRVDSVNCESEYSIQANQQYLFIASARSSVADEGVSADSYGYSAYQPVYIVDDSAPVISMISGNITVDYNPSGTSYTMSGTLYLTFDKDIYYYENATSRLPFAAADSASTKGIRHFQQLNGAGTASVDSQTIEPDSIANSRTVELTVKPGAKEGDYFLATPYLVSYYSSPDAGKQLRITLNFDGVSQKVTATVSPTDWYPAATTELNTTVNAPAVTGITLSPSTLALNVGESYDVSAVFAPTGSAGTVTWTFTSNPNDPSDPGDPTAVSLVPGSTDATVTAAKAGTAYIRATLNGNAGVSAVLTVIVRADPSITLNTSYLPLPRTNSATLTAVVSNVNNYTIVWTSSNSSVVQVGYNTGVVTAIGAVGQSATITATIYQNGKSIGVSDICRVEIT